MSDELKMAIELAARGWQLADSLHLSVQEWRERAEKAEKEAERLRAYNAQQWGREAEVARAEAREMFEPGLASKVEQLTKELEEARNAERTLTETWKRLLAESGVIRSSVDNAFIKLRSAFNVPDGASWEGTVDAAIETLASERAALVSARKEAHGLLDVLHGRYDVNKYPQYGTVRTGYNILQDRLKDVASAQREKCVEQLTGCLRRMIQVMPFQQVEIVKLFMEMRLLIGDTSLVTDKNE